MVSFCELWKRQNGCPCAGPPVNGPAFRCPPGMENLKCCGLCQAVCPAGPVFCHPSRFDTPRYPRPRLYFDVIANEWGQSVPSVGGSQDLPPPHVPQSLREGRGGQAMSMGQALGTGWGSLPCLLIQVFMRAKPGLRGSCLPAPRSPAPPRPAMPGLRPSPRQQPPRHRSLTREVSERQGRCQGRLAMTGRAGQPFYIVRKSRARPRA